MKVTLSGACLVGACYAGIVFANETKTSTTTGAASRVGTCQQAKEQRKYWCEERSKVTVIQTGLECENAKRNVLEACEGKKSKDSVYK